jgi:hypothetical protein
MDTSRGDPRRWTLRARLLAALLALLAAISVVVGVVSVLSLDSFLVGRLDSQLAAASGRIQTGTTFTVRLPATGVPGQDGSAG